MVDLVFTALGPSSSKPLETFSEITAKYDCNIANSHMLRLGNEIIFYGLVSGNWDGIAKLESALQSFQSQKGISIIFKRTEPPKPDSNIIPFTAQVFSVDKPGIALDVVRFFEETNIEIISWRTFTYTVSNSDTQLCTIYCQVNVPADYNISDLRDQYLVFCDELNYDGIIEPDKP